MTEYVTPSLRSRTGQFTTGAINIRWPTRAVDDIALLIVECSGDDATLDMASQGFAHIPGSPFVDVADATGSKLQILWKRLTTTTIDNVTHADIGDHVFAELILLRDCRRDGNPWDYLAVTIKDSASSSYSYPDVIAPTVDSYILLVGSHPIDTTATGVFSLPTNANLSAITQRRNASVSYGNGGGVAVFDAICPVAGPIGDSSGTLSFASTNVLVSLAFRRTPKTFTFWRILTTYVGAPVAGATVEIAEVEFRREVGGDDWATGGTPFASSGTASAAYDNNALTSWQTNSALPQSISYFRSSPPAAVAEVVLTAGDTATKASRMPTDFTVQHSSNNSVWTDHWEVTGEPDWSPGETRYYIGPQDTIYEPSETYTAEPDVTEADEGDTVTFDITAPADDTLYYQITGDITADDIASGTLTGTITITAGVGSLAVELLEDGTEEGAEEFAVELYTDIGLTELVATSDTVTVADTSTVKTYAITNDTGNDLINEGEVVTYTITTDGVVDGSLLWWRKKNTGETETVIIENAPEVEHYTGTITSTGASTLTDNTATWTPGEWVGESVETDDGTQVITANTIDTLTVTDPWAVEPTGVYRIITPADTTEYSTDNSIDSYDIEESETSFLSDGPIEITGGVGTFELTLINDFSTDGLEYIVIDIYDEQGAPFGDGEPVATSDPVIVLDTSNSEGVSFAVTATVAGSPVSSVDEGQEIVFQVLVSEQPPAPYLIYYSIAGTVSAGDFSGGLSGSIEIDEFGVGSVTKTVTADTTTEGAETFTFRLHTGHSGGPQVATTPTITINDTSTSPPTYGISAPTSVNEGATVNATVTTTNVPDGTVLYWSTEGDVTTADFVDGQLAGSVTINSNSGTIPRAITADLLTEGDGFEDGAVASATSDTMTVTGAGWTVDEWAGKLVKITNGTGDDQFLTVASNTADTLTLTVAWDVVPDATSTYRLFTETFRILLWQGGVGGTLLAETNQIRIIDTSVNPPEYYLSGGGTVAEGSSIGFMLTTEFVLDSTLYWTISGSATGADFAQGGSGTISGGGGSITLTALRDYLAEGNETFVLQIRTGSIAGPIVAVSDPVTVIDSGYSITPNKTQIVESESINFRVETVNHPSVTLYWTVSGSISATDFVSGVDEGSVVISGGIGNIPMQIVATINGPLFFYVELRHTSVAGPIIAISQAVIVREIETPTYDEWLSGLIDTERVLLVQMDHAEGTEYFANYPYNIGAQPYDDVLADAIDIETRIDGQFTLGEIGIVNDSRYTSWIANKWRGHQIRMYMGEPDWPFDEFNLVALARNGGLSGVQAGRLAWDVYDSKAIFAQPLQDDLLADGNPIPIALGVPFNVTPALIDDPTYEYQLNDGAVVSAAVRDNGAVVSATLDTGDGTFTLSARPQGNIGADVVTAITTPAAIIAWVCDRYGIDLDSTSSAALPEYDMGLWFNGPATGVDVLNAVMQSIGGYWLVNALEEVEVYQLEEPSVTPDFLLTDDDIIDNSMRLLATEEPVRTLTVNYKRNWSPVSRDSLAGILDTSPAFAEDLTKEWRQVTDTNDTSDYPLAQDLTINSYIDGAGDAGIEVARIAALRAVRRERWEVDCFLSAANAQVGKTVRIVAQGLGWDSGRNAVILSVRRDLSRNRVTLEVWL